MRCVTGWADVGDTGERDRALRECPPVVCAPTTTVAFVGLLVPVLLGRTPAGGGLALAYLLLAYRDRPDLRSTLGTQASLDGEILRAGS
jgi:hypothetical protein